MRLPLLAASSGLLLAVAGLAGNLVVLVAVVGLAGMFVAPALTTAYLIADESVAPEARTQAGAWPDPNMGIVLAAGAGALGVKLGMPLTEVEGLQPRAELGLGEAAEPPVLDSAVGLLWRALVLWVLVLLVLSVVRVF